MVSPVVPSLSRCSRHCWNNPWLVIQFLAIFHEQTGRIFRTFWSLVITSRADEGAKAVWFFIIKTMNWWLDMAGFSCADCVIWAVIRNALAVCSYRGLWYSFVRTASVPRTCTEFGRNAFMLVVPTTWNNLQNVYKLLSFIPLDVFKYRVSENVTKALVAWVSHTHRGRVTGFSLRLGCVGWIMSWWKVSAVLNKPVGSLSCVCMGCPWGDAMCVAQRSLWLAFMVNLVYKSSPAFAVSLTKTLARPPCDHAAPG